MSEDVKDEFATRLDLLGGATIFQVSLEDKALTTPFAADRQFFYWDVLSSIRQIPGVAAASVVAPRRTAITLSTVDRRGEALLVAVDNEFWDLHGFTPLAGRLFSRQQAVNGERVCVIGDEVARRLFAGIEVAGRGLIVGNDVFEVSGVIGGLRVGAGANMVFVPLAVALGRVGDMTLPRRMFVRCRSWEEVEEVAASVPETVGEYLFTDGLRVEVDRPTLRRVQVVARWIESFAHISAWVTLILGGIGIWNVMSAEVRARTREIGLKKAVGAEDRDILLQFLAESLTLSLGAAVPGTLAGWAMLEGVSRFLGRHPPAEVVAGNLALAILVAVALGVGAGLYPSIIASRKEVAESLRCS